MPLVESGVKIKELRMLDWPNINTWKVLVVEDDPDNRAVIGDVLEFHGMTVKTAENGVEGLQVLQTFVPTFILLDLSMPKMDGWEMRTRVKSTQGFETIPIVALTAHAMPDDKKRVLDAGFDGYLKKPINVGTLLDDLRATLEREVTAIPQSTNAEDKRASMHNST
jgi:two-component system cell cycle response regulator DivK